MQKLFLSFSFPYSIRDKYLGNDSNLTTNDPHTLSTHMQGFMGNLRWPFTTTLDESHGRLPGNVTALTENQDSTYTTDIEFYD